MRILKKIGVISLGIIFLFIGISYVLAISKYEMPKYEPSSKLADQIIDAQGVGGSVEADEENINALVSYFLQRPVEKKGVKIKNAYVNLIEDRIRTFVLVNYKDKDLYFNFDFKINDEGNALVISPIKFRIGKMPLPLNLVINRFKDLEYFKNGNIVIDKNTLPINIENLTYKDRKVEIKLGKINLLEPLKKQENLVKNPESVEKNEQESSKKESSKSSTKIKEGTSKKLPDDVVNSLKKISSGLNKVYPNLKTQEERAIISTIQSTLNKVAKDPDYPYKKYADSVKAKYKKLPEESKQRIKSALFSNLDLGDVMKLVSLFGM
ncbi:hypothetical protein Q3V94_10845 [Caloramator sp. CAR-1]|uniref:hypothetical protein n=1 Tax=Caloramator sp. CAR-1 TaxID=3062777 RepID=UPI0026E15D84|nr:hypothetical protein [Caloramator sp. CAR-1]MDO6355552.1 hypothetical protein [Caloramator sp. CAR-1]